MKNLFIISVYILSTTLPTASLSSELCSTINSADLDVAKHQYDEYAYRRFHSTITDSLEDIARAQLIGADNNADELLAVMLSEVKIIIDFDTNMRVPNEHVSFMRLYNEYIKKHQEMVLTDLFPNEWVSKYQEMYVEKLKQYAKHHNKVLMNSECDAAGSVRALETLVLVDAYFGDHLSFSDSDFRAEYRKTSVDHINRCSVSGTVTGRVSYAEEMQCVSTGDSYYEPDPFFYTWSLGEAMKSNYEARVDCKKIDPQMGVVQGVSYLSNVATARLKLDEMYKVSLENVVQFDSGVEAYLFSCKTMKLPKRKLSRAELESFARTLSEEGTGCAASILTQDASGGDVSIRSEGVDILHGSGSPGYAGPPAITLDPSGEGPIISGETMMEPDVPPVTINWQCTVPYKILSTNVNDVVTDADALRIFNNADLTMDIQD